ncbi:hypothetical protein BFU36_00710 [Sulfolobus sp. A20]|uniref:DUF973 family protein n=1 Tax=Saccharolobus sp. A20 TaxID=1891280 RepID=UPI000845CD51|nr:DUF973 family protein [Sulfolobus sp. A20]TRM73883.1 DUF973 domain-containing protein [Sulfolobus sp. A20-N-F8]TRM76300.1 DUF973 domain-containing protein [Sulfolobus sp. E5]TRM84025.1 DUF973 domain-containing protein [Sulfolobus sp. A20-N-F6]TRM84989.1 DUF973 domain-containing protein [Sulfolobus sp. F3]TRM88569.1 DUF973 domain-containing protein [Sulfolobus sp. C3]TRM94796.1 DUF973 domain-containing protein [Sulfolobus sp. A20-N-G8]TRN02669.1 DUF973 domain-containing protein [Sulfolobus
MTQQNTEILGLTKLREGVLFYLIASILGIIIGVTYALALSSILAIAPSGVSGLLPILISGLIISLITIPILVLSYLRTREGFRLLVSTGKDLRQGLTATTLILVGIVIIFIGFLSFIAVLSTISTVRVSSLPSLFGSVAILLIGGIIAFIGYIILALSYRRTGEIYMNDNLKTGGLLVLIGSILGLFIGIIGYILNLIGFIMIYSGLGELVKTLPQRQVNIPQAPPPTGPISQIGVGTLYSNGVATLTIYSQYILQMLSATLLGTNYVTSDIVPSQLNVGYNTVRINFRTSFALVPGNIYTIQIALSNGQTLTVIVTYQP